MVRVELSFKELLRMIILVVLISYFAIVNSQDEENNQLFTPFDSKQFSVDDLRILQAALALKGDYISLIDGKWGKGSDKSFVKYSQRESSTTPKNYHVAILLLDYFDSIDSYGWKMINLKELGLSLLMPTSRMSESSSSESFISYPVQDSSLGISTNIGNQQKMTEIHDFAMQQEKGSEPYVLRKKNTWITAYHTASEGRIYVRSNYHNGLWGTVYLSSDATEANLVNLIASSMSHDPNAEIKLDINGRLNYITKILLVYMDSLEQEDSKLESSQSKSQINSAAIVGSGTGFYVSSDGYILTNAHVIENCSSISVNGEFLKFIDISEVYDLAILQDMSVNKSLAYAKFSLYPARLNSDITVIGYPLTGILGGINVTRGSISALSGLGGDENSYQITAPVQAGNSGGPIVNSSGRIVAVVVSKLREDRVAELAGDIPQNVNFAIKGEIAKNYLFTNRINYEMSNDNRTISAEDIAEEADDYTVLLSCHN